MKRSDGRFTGAGDHSIYFQCWEPEAASRALILIAHGAGEHSARYRLLAQYFTGHNYAVAALDLVGHGNSEGQPGFVNSFDDYLQDFGQFHRQLVARFPGLPVLFLGHSMGGLIGSIYLLQQQGEFVGAIMSGPAIKNDLEPGVIQMSLLRLLAAITPRVGIHKLNENGVSRDPDVVKDYVLDPLVFHGKMSARLLRELFRGMHAIQTAAAGLTLPLLIMHGEADVMTSPDGSRFLHQHAGSRDKTLKIYPGLYHEIFNEPERADVLRDVLAWCESRLPPSVRI